VLGYQLGHLVPKLLLGNAMKRKAPALQRAKRCFIQPPKRRVRAKQVGNQRFIIDVKVNQTAPQLQRLRDPRPLFLFQPKVDNSPLNQLFLPISYSNQKFNFTKQVLLV
jgi:hypothetical protein